MTRLAIAVVCLLPLHAAAPLLKGVEDRYNRVKTLKISFEETYAAQGRAKQIEKGTLHLRKPGKMRWDYAEPAGKLFISDGKDFYYYNPATRQAEKMKIKEADDMRAPLAFLLGRLDFDKDFKSIQTRPDGASTWVTAEPRSEKLPYKKVEFLVSPQSEISRLNVTGLDNSILTFAFSGETVNPAVNDNMFRFVLPPGATLIQGGQGN